MGDQPGRHEPGERLYLAGSTVVHRLAPERKVLAAFATILVVVLTPAHYVGAFLCYAVLLAALVAVARVPPNAVLRRLTVAIPFLAFAVLLPFLGRDPQVEIGPLELSEPGLWAAWNVLVKATLALVVSITLAATTTTSDLVVGLQRLRLPALLVGILAAMVRFVHVVTAESERMARARAARGFSARGPRAWPVLGRALGTLFIRSYERGERVHLAMLSRGFTGVVPDLGSPTAAAPAWIAAILPLTAAGVLAIALLVAR